mmetsp:Transcript_11324/g.38730  ORF Transcript_11324/g.38730 Transcript_11324/m.38730 type:complete len:128 (-) Transcript_11324:134-517(-)
MQYPISIDEDDLRKKSRFVSSYLLDHLDKWRRLPEGQEPADVRQVDPDRFPLLIQDLKLVSITALRLRCCIESPSLREIPSQLVKPPPPPSFQASTKYQLLLLFPNLQRSRDRMLTRRRPSLLPARV